MVSFGGQSVASSRLDYFNFIRHLVEFVTQIKRQLLLLLFAWGEAGYGFVDMPQKAILGTADALVKKGDFKGIGTAFKDA